MELGVESNRPTTLTLANDAKGKVSGYLSVSDGVGCRIKQTDNTLATDAKGKVSGYLSVSDGVGCRINTCGEKERAVKNKETACSPKEKDRTAIQNTATFPFKNGFSGND